MPAAGAYVPDDPRVDQRHEHWGADGVERALPAEVGVPGPCERARIVVALRAELEKAEVLGGPERCRRVGPEAKAALPEPRVEPPLPAALVQQAVDRLECCTVVGDVHPRQVADLARWL